MTFPFVADSRAADRVDPDPVGRGAFGEEDTVAVDAQRPSPGLVGPDEIARDDLPSVPVPYISMPSLSLPAITFRSPTSSTLLPSVPIRLPEAPAEIATPPPKVSPRESLTGCVPLFRAVVPEMSVPMNCPRRHCHRCPAR